MVKVVVLGAHGQVAQIAERFLFADKDVEKAININKNRNEL